MRAGLFQGLGKVRLVWIQPFSDHWAEALVLRQNEREADLAMVSIKAKMEG